MGTGRAQEGPQLPCILGVNSFICPSGLELRLREVKSCTDPETWPQETVSLGVAQKCLRYSPREFGPFLNYRESSRCFRVDVSPCS